MVLLAERTQRHVLVLVKDQLLERLSRAPFRMPEAARRSPSLRARKSSTHELSEHCAADQSLGECFPSASIQTAAADPAFHKLLEE